MNILVGVLILAVPSCCPKLFMPQIKDTGPKPWMSRFLQLYKIWKHRKKKKKTRNAEKNRPPNFLPWFPPHLLRLSWSPWSNGEDVCSCIGAAEAKGTHSRIAYQLETSGGDGKIRIRLDDRRIRRKQQKKRGPGWAHQVLNKPNLGKMASCLPHSKNYITQWNFNWTHLYRIPQQKHGDPQTTTFPPEKIHTFPAAEAPDWFPYSASSVLKTVGYPFTWRCFSGEVFAGCIPGCFFEKVRKIGTTKETRPFQGRMLLNVC